MIGIVFLNNNLFIRLLILEIYLLFVYNFHLKLKYIHRHGLDADLKTGKSDK